MRAAAPFETTFGLIRGAGETVNHGSRGNALAGENVEEVVEGVASVHHERQVKFDGQGNLGGEGPSLIASWCVFVVVIETAFTNPHEPSVPLTGQSGDWSEVFSGLVWVQSYRGEELHVTRQIRNGERFARRSGVSANHDNAIDLRGSRPGEGVSSVAFCLPVPQILVLKVTVRVSPKTHASAFIRGKRGSPFSMALTGSY